MSVVTPDGLKVTQLLRWSFFFIKVTQLLRWSFHQGDSFKVTFRGDLGVKAGWPQGDLDDSKNLPQTRWPWGDLKRMAPKVTLKWPQGDGPQGDLKVNPMTSSWRYTDGLLSHLLFFPEKWYIFPMYTYFFKLWFVFQMRNIKAKMLCRYSILCF